MVSESKNRYLARKRTLLAGVVFIAVAWALTATSGVHDIQAFVETEASTASPRDLMIVHEANRAEKLAAQGIKAPHWLYTGNAATPMPFVVSVDVDFTRGSGWWSPRRVYYFWCFGLHSTEPLVSRQVEH